MLWENKADPERDEGVSKVEVLEWGERGSILGRRQSSAKILQCSRERSVLKLYFGELSVLRARIPS